MKEKVAKKWFIFRERIDDFSRADLFGNSREEFEQI